MVDAAEYGCMLSDGESKGTVTRRDQDDPQDKPVVVLSRAEEHVPDSPFFLGRGGSANRLRSDACAAARA